MKIIHTADWHLGKNIEGRSRLPEQERFLNDFVDLCREEAADLILIAGDVYDSYNPPALAEQLFYDTLKRLSRSGACMIAILAGNHDNPERLTASGPLAREHGILMAGTPGDVIAPGRYGENEITGSGVGYVQATIHGEKADLLLLPFPSERRMGALFLEEGAEETDKAAAYERQLSSYFKEAAKAFRPDAIHLVMSHLFVMEAREDGSERSIQLGGSYLVSGNIFPQEADYIALGHIHRPQRVPGCPKARYSGSPLHYNRRETAHEKQVFSICLHAGEAAEIRSIPLPAYKPIEVWRCADAEEAIRKCTENANRDCWVYLEIETDSYIREEDIRAMKREKADILAITPIFSGAAEKAAALPHRKEQPLEELVKEFYQKKFQTEMDEETWAVFLEIMGEEDA